MLHVFEGVGRLLHERAAFQAAIFEGQVLAERIGHLLPGFTRHAQIKAIHTAEEINTYAAKLGYRAAPFHGSHVVEAKTVTSEEALSWYVNHQRNSPHPFVGLSALTIFKIVREKMGLVLNHAHICTKYVTPSEVAQILKEFNREDYAVSHLLYS